MITKETKPGKRVLETSLQASRARKAYWAALKEARSKGIPIVATVGLLPREMWYAMDVPSLGMESLLLQISAKQLAGNYCEMAEQQGFARELCAAHLTVLGVAASEDRDSYVESMFVKPDLIIGSNFPCVAESKSFLYWVEQFGVPYHVVDIPINTSGKQPQKHAVEYVAAELRSMAAFLEKHGFKYDPARLSRAVKNSRRTMELWQEVEGFRMTRPVPMTTTDALSCIANTMLTLLGSDLGVEIMQRLRDEVAGRVSRKEGVIDDERFRLYMVGVPPTYNLGLLDYPEKYGGVVVKSDLDLTGGCIIDTNVLDPEHPLESIAAKQLTDVLNPCYANKLDLSVDMVRDYHIDGVIGLNKRGCRNLPAALRLIKDLVYQETGVPMTIFDLDGIDAREYNDSQVKSNIDAFMETLIAGKAGG